MATWLRPVVFGTSGGRTSEPVKGDVQAMARVIILLLSVVVVLNALIFLLVVAQAPESSAENPSDVTVEDLLRRSAEAAKTERRSMGSKIDSVANLVKRMSSDMSSLRTKMTSLERKIQNLEKELADAGRPPARPVEVPEEEPLEEEPEPEPEPDTGPGGEDEGGQE